MGKKPAKQSGKAAAATGAASKGKAGKKKQQSTSSSNGYDSLRAPLDRQLALLGLRVKNITADGNCFFRALSDQLQGDEGRHSELRAQVCTLMAEQEEGFAPFVEDDQTLETYLARMKREGVWAGHMELQAASLLLKSNIAVYQAGQPRWCITNFPAGSPMLHLSYHDGEHYNSVRRADDYSRGTAAEIPETLQPVADVAQAQQCWSAADEKLVADDTGCENPILIRQQLEQSGGDVDAAVEAVIQIMADDDYVDTTAAGAAAGDTGQQAEAEVGGEGVEGRAVAAAAAGGEVTELSGFSVPAAAEAGQQAACYDTSREQQQQEQEEEQQQQQQQPDTAESSAPEQVSSSSNSTGHSPAAAAAAAAAGDSAGSPTASSTKGSKSSKAKGVKLKRSSSSSVSTKRGADKGPSRNKACPCGSGRKHKNCCGAGVGGHKGAAKSAAAAAAVDMLPAALGTLHI